MGGFLQHVDQFDSKFFGLASAHAQDIDPTERILAEVCSEAMYGAGHAARPPDLRCSLFVCLAANEYHSPSAYECQAPRLLASLLAINGEFHNVNTGCSSSLVAVDKSCRCLQHQSDMALVGTGVCMLNPLTSFGAKQGGILSSAGVCRPYDSQSLGIVRGEGFASLVLERGSRSRAIHGTIIGTATNRDNTSYPVGTPDAEAQELCVRAAFRQAKYAVSDSAAMVGHGLGTRVGDHAEVEALLNACDCEGPLLTSHKANIGHTFLPSGLLALVEVRSARLTLLPFEISGPDMVTRSLLVCLLLCILCR